MLGEAASYAELTALATAAELGGDLVVWDSYGDSGKTTFFIASEPDWDSCAADVIGQQLKIMRRINNKAAAVGVHHQARHDRRAVHDRPDRIPGTHPVQGRVVQEMTCSPRRCPRLTPSHRDRAGPQAGQVRAPRNGYQGFLEIDVLVDLDHRRGLPGELNPRTLRGLID